MHHKKRPYFFISFFFRPYLSYIGFKYGFPFGETEYMLEHHSANIYIYNTLAKLLEPGLKLKFVDFLCGLQKILGLYFLYIKP